MKIPTQFELFGQTIKVEYNSGLVERELYGEALFAENKIILTTAELNHHVIEEIFFHELVHFILHYATSHNSEKYKLVDGTEVRLDETLVDLSGNLLHQALKTSIGELKLKK